MLFTLVTAAPAIEPIAVIQFATVSQFLDKVLVIGEPPSTVTIRSCVYVFPRTVVGLVNNNFAFVPEEAPITILLSAPARNKWTKWTCCSRWWHIIYC